MMKSKRLVLFALLGVVALLATGCQWARWLRLLSLKKQLAQVERYVQVQDEGGLSLRFLKPVVYCDDLSLLIGDETLRTTNKDHITWVWTYEKQSPTGTKDPTAADLSITMGFQNLKFNEMRFPEPFLALMPKPLIIGLLRSVGQAEVDVRHGRVKMKWVGPGAGQRVELPTRSQVIKSLGSPFWLTETNHIRTYLYKYYQKLPTANPPAERLAWVRFTVADDGDEIASSEGVIGNIAWSMTRVPGQAEARVTFRLTEVTVEPVAVALPPQIAQGFVGQYQEPGGTVLSIGWDGEAFTMSWIKEKTGGWCLALPETTNALFALPAGVPQGKFLQDVSGVVTGVVARLQGPDTVFTKIANQLPPTPTAVRLEPAALAACAGRYKTSWHDTVILTQKGEQLCWQTRGIRARLPLYPASETNFFFKAVDSPLTFVKNAQGEVTKFILHFHGHEAEAVRVGSPPPESGAHTHEKSETDSS
jgi:hypothetical protein